ncbi:AAA domain-containing protein [Prosthecobacter debontii]|uniref:AAA domain-containing protein n=1 Tax=Prosthecobacter debontii TaxID=48467 RepID=A0A1T4YR67_9BACT|nr:AAA family ATPase [Prosthecobacter debontii]SKB04163.1 AAA domain-containing protein [Prosthecobacter debontii]
MTPEERIITYIPEPVTETLSAPSAEVQEEPPPPRITFEPPSFYLNYVVPPDALLIGEHHFVRGDITVIGGVPGCGKSRLLTSLAIAGKLGPGHEWMGLSVNAHFKTAIIQNENGLVRVRNELRAIQVQGHDLDDWLHITPPPPFGIGFTDPVFREELQVWLQQIQPGILAIDPWNRCVDDDKARDYRAVIEAIHSVIPAEIPKPAIVIVHHLRKQSLGDPRRRGRDLLNELSGSYIIGSACRAAFVLEPVTAQGSDDRLLFTCAKNNDGPMGEPTVWHRRDGLFARCTDFDWDEWENGGPNKRRAIDLEDLAAVFEDGDKTMSRKEAALALQSHCPASARSSVYEALRTDGRFSRHLSEVSGFLIFRP